MPATRLKVEQLEVRHCPSNGYLLVTSFDTHHVPRYSGSTGGFIDEFLGRRRGGLIQPYGIVFGPHDNDLYVTSGQFGGVGQTRGVLRYDGDTGAFLGVFADDTHLASPRGIIFGTDGDLYVADFTGPAGGRVVRFDGATGAFLGEFVPVGSGLGRAQGLVFGPDANGDGNLDLYVASAEPNNILHYDGVTGESLGAFVPGVALLDRPTGITFGPDGNLYAANYAAGRGHTAVLRFQGPAGPNPGAPLPSAGNGGADFVPVGGGGLRTPFGVLFGPDGNGDGHQDLYVASCEVVSGGSLKAKQNTNTVLRYDGVTGAFIDTFVSIDSGGLRNPGLMTFTETDPVTLAYTGGSGSAVFAPTGFVPEPVPVREAGPPPPGRPARPDPPPTGDTTGPRGGDRLAPEVGPGRGAGDVIGVFLWGIELDTTGPLGFPP